MLGTTVRTLAVAPGYLSFSYSLGIQAKTTDSVTVINVQRLGPALRVPESVTVVVLVAE